MDFEKLQDEIYEILQDGLSDFEDKKYTTIECEDMAKSITDLVMRRMDIPDSHVMRMGNQAMEIDRLTTRILELEEKLRWIPVSERIPEKFHSYDVIKNGKKFWDFYSPNGYNRSWENGEITHWREVPEL